jgi:hypothetical protein
MTKAKDLVYICRDGDNEELRYSIRSAVQNLPHGKIWVVGGKPDWYMGRYIQVDQDKAKYINARNSLRAICESEEISESFTLMNDDFYIVNKVKSVPYMYSGTLIDKINQREEMLSGNLYISLLKQTLASLSRKRIESVLDYELHVPMVMDKSKLAQILDLSGLWRSTYGNLFNVGGIETKDVKVYTKKSKLYRSSYDIKTLESDYVSSSDDSFELLRIKILEKLFPEKSIYEA